MGNHKLHIATSRPVGEACRAWATLTGFSFVPMEECEVFISVMYDQLIDQDFIAKRKCFNFHPGVLPWYRGSGAYSWAILNGELETGVTLHEIDRDIDHGNVIAIERFAIEDNDTAGTLFKKAEKTMYEMFQEWLPKLLAGEYTASPQTSGRIYYRKDLDQAKDITRFARAFHFKGKEQAYYYTKTGEKVYLRYE